MIHHESKLPWKRGDRRDRKFLNAHYNMDTLCTSITQRCNYEEWEVNLYWLQVKLLIKTGLGIGPTCVILDITHILFKPEFSPL